MKKICFITSSPPNYLGGLSLFHKNLLNYLKTKDLNITWTYFGNKNRQYKSKDINYFEIKRSILQPKFIENNYKVKKFLKKNYFDVVFTTGGFWTFFYFKPINQKLIHIFHGTVYYFNKNHLKRLSFCKRLLLSPLLSFSKISELPSWDCDNIICVSNKVKKQVEELYGKDKMKVIRTGVDLNEFKPRKVKGKKKLYGLYVGGGGWYTKGLDRAIKLSKEIYKLNLNYRLIIIGPDKSKVRDLINEPFIIFKENIPRDNMKFYYNSSDIFFCMSRYEGGAPTLVVSEAMASGCLVVCSKDSEQEIIKNNKNGLIINSYEIKSAKRILNTPRKILIKNAFKTIEKFSLENWGDKFLKIINDEKNR